MDWVEGNDNHPHMIVPPPQPVPVAASFAENGGFLAGVRRRLAGGNRDAENNDDDDDDTVTTTGAQSNLNNIFECCGGGIAGAACASGICVKSYPTDSNSDFRAGAHAFRKLLSFNNAAGNNEVKLSTFTGTVQAAFESTNGQGGTPMCTGGEDVTNCPTGLPIGSTFELGWRNE